MSSLLDRRLIFISGKGGVGKTTVALCLGLLAAEQGRRCLLVEIDTTGVLPARFGRTPQKLGRPVELKSGLSSMVVEGRAALDEYLQLILPSALLRPIFGSKIYEYFVAGAPGLKELMCIGKIFYEVERKERDRPVWDLVVVDAPATGHGLELYRMPQAAHDTFSVGLVHRETERVLALLRDPALTMHVLVTLAEELPVSETLELHAALRDELRFPLGPLVVNRFLDEPFDPALEPELVSLRQGLSAAEPWQGLVLDAADKTSVFSDVHRENVRQLERLRAAVGEPLVVLPALFEQDLSPAALAPLVRQLDEQLSALGAADAPAEPSETRG